MIVDDSQNYHQLLSAIKRVVKRLNETGAEPKKVYREPLVSDTREV